MEKLPWCENRATEIVQAHSGLEGAMLPVLHAIQEAFGYIPDAAIPRIATALNVSRAEVHGVVSFYHDFRRVPAGRYVLKLCRAEACQSMGAARLASDLLSELEIEWGATTKDGALTVEAVYCLGLCACAPAALLNGQPFGKLDAARLRTIAAEAQK